VGESIFKGLSVSLSHFPHVLIVYIVVCVMHPTLYCFQCTNDDDNENNHTENLNKLIQTIIRNSALKFWTMNCVNMEWISRVFTIKELIVEKK
jgi:hypothetical protein